MGGSQIYQNRTINLEENSDIVIKQSDTEERFTQLVDKMSDGNPFGSNAEEDRAECAKLQQHLSLLRAEFVKCQAERDTLRFNYSKYRL